MDGDSMGTDLLGLSPNRANRRRPVPLTLRGDYSLVPRRSRLRLGPGASLIGFRPIGEPGRCGASHRTPTPQRLANLPPPSLSGSPDHARRCSTSQMGLIDISEAPQPLRRISDLRRAALESGAVVADAVDPRRRLSSLHGAATAGAMVGALLCPTPVQKTPLNRATPNR